MSSKQEIEDLKARIQTLEDQAKEAADLAEAQMGNVQRLTRTVNAHRRVAIDHIRTGLAHPDEAVQILTVAFVTELDVADLNISAEVRVAPKASA